MLSILLPVLCRIIYIYTRVVAVVVLLLHDYYIITKADMNYSITKRSSFLRKKTVALLSSVHTLGDCGSFVQIIIDANIKGDINKPS